MSLTLLSLSFLSASAALTATLDVNKTVDQLVAGGKDVAKWFRECTPFELPEHGHQCACHNMDPAKETQYCHSKEICDTGNCVEADTAKAKKNCSASDPCHLGQGHCVWSKDCLGELVCGNANCHLTRVAFGETVEEMTLKGYQVSDFNGGITNTDCCCKKGDATCGSKRQRQLTKPNKSCNFKSRCTEGYTCRVRHRFAMFGGWKCMLYSEGVEAITGPAGEEVYDDEEELDENKGPDSEANMKPTPNHMKKKTLPKSMIAS